MFVDKFNIAKMNSNLKATPKLAKPPDMPGPGDLIDPIIKIAATVPELIQKAIIGLILTIIGEIIHICFPIGGITALSCPEAAISFANIYEAFQFKEKNEII